MLSSRSSRYFLTYGAFIRAVTFQSMLRMSSPGSYSRTSSKSRPEPRKTLRYVHTSASSARMRALISTCLTTRRTSGGTGSARGWAVACLTSRNRDVVEDAADDRLRGDLLRLGLVRHDEPMAHDVEGDGLYIIGQHVVASVEERVGPSRERHVDRGARRDAIRDERLQVGELGTLRFTRRHDDAHHVVLHGIVHVHLAHGGSRADDRGGGRELARARRLLDGVPVHDHALLIGRWIADDDLHHEAVYLGFR